MDVEDLWEEVRDDPAFDWLRSGGARLVPGFGRRPTSVMVVADSPGAVESGNLRPFSGRNGRILRELMGLAGLRIGGEDANCWATYLVKYRVPTEMTMNWVLRAVPYIRKEWKLVGGPRLIVCVGAATWGVLGPAAVGGLRAWAGNPLPTPGDRWVAGMYSPGYGLQYPDKQDTIERHWERLGDFLLQMDLL